jgi:hypothetical protein
MLSRLKEKCDKWLEVNYAQYAVESLTDDEKGFVRHPQNNIFIEDSELLLFVLRSSIHYGGNWYYWFNQSIESGNEKETLRILLLSLDMSYDRGKWRILFLLQFCSNETLNDCLEEIGNISNENKTNVLKYSLNRNVLSYLNDISKKYKSKVQKVEVVLGEINNYIPSSLISKLKPIKTNYKVFISYSKRDLAIAKVIATSINNIFRGDVEVFFAPKDIKVGQKWKETILNALKEYDAIISLISEETHEKPWIIAEFSAFWLQSKDVYVLKYGNVDYSKIFSIFADQHICDIESQKDVTDLIEALSNKAEVEFAPYGKASKFSEEIQNAIVKN